MPKPKLTGSQLETFLRREVGQIDSFDQMVEGMESQVFCYRLDGNPYVLRINTSITGFKKDKYAYDTFHSQQIPIPKIEKIGWIDEDHAFCVGEKMVGTTLQDTDPHILEGLLEPTADLWQAISKVDISSTSGYGSFDASGIGPFPSWKAYLLSILDEEFYQWNKLEAEADQGVIRDAMRELERLVDYCPEDRHLVHGDFGSNNVLNDGKRITAVIDWDCASYGDPLVDVNGFWRPWLVCMEMQGQYVDRHFSHLLNYDERMRCYQLRTGLSEIYSNVVDYDAKTLAWVTNRTKQVLDL